MKRRPIIAIILFILCLALLGHVVWCLVHHIHGEKSEPLCSVCGKVESECVCRQTIDALRRQLAEIQVQATDARNTDLVLIEECNHPHWDENTLVEWDSSDNPVIIGTEDGCIAYYCGQKAICADCGEEIIIAHYTTEPGHQFGDDDICDRCGYQKPAEPEVKTVYVYVTPTPAPTPEPTPVPTAEPTPVPTAEPTPVPTAEPTPEPTAEPCKHKHTRYEYGEWECQGVCSDPEDGHVISRLKYTYCKDCGILLDVEQESKVEAHEFDRTGTCKICGYKPQQPSYPSYPSYPVWPGRNPLGEDSGTAPGTIGDGDTYTDPGTPGTPIETYEDPGTPGTPVESYTDPGTPGTPVESYTDPGKTGTPVESYTDPGKTGAPVEGYTDGGAAGTPIDGAPSPLGSDEGEAEGSIFEDPGTPGTPIN